LVPCIYQWREQSCFFLSSYLRVVIDSSLGVRDQLRIFPARTRYQRHFNSVLHWTNACLFRSQWSWGVQPPDLVRLEGVPCPQIGGGRLDPSFNGRRQISLWPSRRSPVSCRTIWIPGTLPPLELPISFLYRHAVFLFEPLREVNALLSTPPSLRPPNVVPCPTFLTFSWELLGGFHLEARSQHYLCAKSHLPFLVSLCPFPKGPYPS